MEPKPFLNRHARRAAAVQARRLARYACDRGMSVVEMHAAQAAAPPRKPCGVRRYSVSKAVRALEASGQKRRPR